MEFLIQSDDIGLQIENTIIKEVIESQKCAHHVMDCTLSYLRCTQDMKKGLIPIGTIDFVTEYLRQTEDFKKENPIEIPKYLRTDKFLKREYSVVSWDKIPSTGKYFLKDASTLKHFSYCGDLERFIQKDTFEKPNFEFDTSLRLSKEAMYILSEPQNILSEYRVYVIDEQIEAIAQYDGSPLISPDTELIKEAVDLINKNERLLKSYTIDIMVTERGTSIIEIHNFTSCGLYTTLFGSNLLYAYRQGIDYLLYDNRELEI